MARRRILVLALVIAAAGLAGCMSDEPQDGEFVMTLSVHPPDEDVDNRSDIDDFQSLVVRVHAYQLYTQDDNDRLKIFPRTSYDFTSIAGDDPTETGRKTVEPANFDKMTIRVTVEEAIHQNGTRPEVHTPGAGLYIRNYPQDTVINVSKGEEVIHRWHFAVTQDDEDIDNARVPENEYFLRLIAGTGPVK